MQNDLFEIPSSFQTPEKVSKLAFLDKYRVTLRADQVLLGVIAFIVLYVFVFSSGVEKGKLYALDELKAERNKREEIVREMRHKLGNSFASKPVKKQVLEVKKPEAAEVKALPQDKAEVAKAAPVEKKQPELTEKVSAIPPGKYTIQIVTYKTQQAADKLISNLSGKGHRGFVIPSGDYLQVCVDAFESRQQAKQGLAVLQSSGIAPADAYIRSIPH